MRTRLRRQLAAAVSLAVLAAGAVSCGSEERPLQGVVRHPPLHVGAITLPHAAKRGEMVPMKAPPGELLLVYFGFTNCPDICPTTMSDIRVALDDLGEGDKGRVTVAMVTVDPERDTDEVLTTYLGHFFDKALPLRTTDTNMLGAAAGAFGVSYQLAAHTPGTTDYDVAHTAITYVVDDTGTVVAEWPFGFATDSMTSDLTTLLGEEHP